MFGFLILINNDLTDLTLMILSFSDTEETGKRRWYVLLHRLIELKLG